MRESKRTIVNNKCDCGCAIFRIYQGDKIAQCNKCLFQYPLHEYLTSKKNEKTK